MNKATKEKLFQEDLKQIVKQIEDKEKQKDKVIVQHDDWLDITSCYKNTDGECESCQ